MKAILSVLMSAAMAGLMNGAIPLPATPSWISVDNDYATGGALYDVTMDGWVDFCTGNGNDMASNTNAIYVNVSGTLEATASWRSMETGYFSHLYIGDVDNDGRPDMAVAYLGSGSGNQGPTRIYRNTGTGLNRTAWWTSTDQYNAFDCSFGDVDLDGDLDLAVACGDAYSGLRSPTRVYRNNAGTIETNPYWTSIDDSAGDACRWADLNNDGYLDLVVGYRRKFAVFRNISGTLERTASWTNTTVGWVLRLAVGDYNKDGWIDVAVASNAQTGDPNSIKVFKNISGTLETNASFTAWTTRQYSSCVEWGDPNNDGWLDLAAGGWWEPVAVFENTGGTLNTTPAWSWNGGSNLVCETVMWNDVRRRFVVPVSDLRSGNGTRKLFYFTYHPIQSFTEVRVNNNPVPLADFCYDPLTGWIAFRNAPPVGTNNIEIRYTYSRSPDLGVTNWTRAVGNYLFSNQTEVSEEGLAQAAAARASLEVLPNPFAGPARITMNPGVGARSMGLRVFDRSGRLVKTFDLAAIASGPAVISWDGRDDQGKRLPAGVYIVELLTDRSRVSKKIVITR